ncbi:hypothetical protein CCP3SC1AL1_1540005 [Gammaproteobacteria bacterium]
MKQLVRTSPNLDLIKHDAYLGDHSRLALLYFATNKKHIQNQFLILAFSMTYRVQTF